MYIGVSGGGVWRSADFTDAKPTWTPLTDHLPASIPLERQSGLLDIGTLAVDSHHPWIIYAAAEICSKASIVGGC